MGSFGHRAAEQTGSENRQLIEHRNCKREPSVNVEFFEDGAMRRHRDEIGLSHTRPCLQWLDMPATDEEKAKARRAIFILYACMVLGVGLPILLYFLLR